MQETYNDGISINPATRRIKRGIYLERRLTIVGMSEIPEFKAKFQQYKF